VPLPTPESLLGDLAAARISTAEKHVPLFFIAHSLGGIVVKDALQISAAESTHLKDILLATRGVMFLGIPHHGSKVASLGKLAAQVLKVFLQDPNDKILRGLEANSEILERISQDLVIFLPPEIFVCIHSERTLIRMA
jgi:hypothetical protein